MRSVLCARVPNNSMLAACKQLASSLLEAYWPLACSVITRLIAACWQRAAAVATSCHVLSPNDTIGSQYRLYIAAECWWKTLMFRTNNNSHAAACCSRCSRLQQAAAGCSRLQQAVAGNSSLSLSLYRNSHGPHEKTAIMKNCRH